MTWRTHVAAGVCSLWAMKGLSLQPSPTPVGLMITAAALGALLPDLDARGGKLQGLSVAGIRPLAPISGIAHALLGHRGPMHSLAAVAVVGMLATPAALVVGWPPVLALALGYASHLAADACTPSGVPLFYPTRMRYHLLPKQMRIATGSAAEQMLLPFLLIADLALLLNVVRCLISPLPWA